MDRTAKVDDIAARLELDARARPYAVHAYRGGEDDRLPTLYLDDVSAIPFLVNIAGVEEYQHRARVRAGDSDLFAAVTAPVTGYESYCRRTLGLGAPALVPAEPVGSPLEVARACSTGKALATLVERARAAGGLVIHPYMSVEAVWELARLVAREAGAAAHVIGPPPPVCWLANDKKLFGDLVAAVLGDEWLVPTVYASDPKQLARALLRLRRVHDRVGLKRTRCASAMGNEVLDSSSLPAELEGVEARVHAFLERTEWDGREEVLAVAWESTDLSPSTQTWIPPRGRGAPRVEGVYEQILEGTHRVFVGSRPASFSRAAVARMRDASLTVASALQELGYVGRCSFDFLVVGDVDDDPRIHFTECNGRWGGTSIPMSLVDRLLGDPTPRPPYRAQDFVRPGLVGSTFEDLLAAVGEELFDPRRRSGRFVLYNPGPLERSGKIDVVAMGRTQEEAEEALELELPRRLGI